MLPSRMCFLFVEPLCILFKNVCTLLHFSMHVHRYDQLFKSCVCALFHSNWSEIISMYKVYIFCIGRATAGYNIYIKIIHLAEIIWANHLDYGYFPFYCSSLFAVYGFIAVIFAFILYSLLFKFITSICCHKSFNPSSTTLNILKNVCTIYLWLTFILPQLCNRWRHLHLFYTCTSYHHSKSIFVCW